MSTHSETWTIGVEEEYQLIDPHTRRLSVRAEQLQEQLSKTSDIQVSKELHQSQIEIATPVCQSLAEVRAELLRARQNIIIAADAIQCRITAAGTHPFSHWSEQTISTSKRYEIMEQKYQQLTREQVIFGCHVHIGCRNLKDALEINNRARLWLAPLLALTANSPYWNGRDTGYASYRTEIWSRWPMTGPPNYFQTVTDYETLIKTLIDTECIADTTHIYWDIRRSERHATLEFRIMDVCTSIDETVMVAGLVRALVQTCYEQSQQHIPYNPAPTELLRAAQWRAARYGIEQDLIDINRSCSIPAASLIEQMLKMLRPALEENGDWGEVSTLVDLTLQKGNGASRQRERYQKTQEMEAIVDYLIEDFRYSIAET